MGIKLEATGGGSVSISPANTALNVTITAPAVTGTMVVDTALAATAVPFTPTAGIPVSTTQAAVEYVSALTDGTHYRSQTMTGGAALELPIDEATIFNVNLNQATCALTFSALAVLPGTAYHTIINLTQGTGGVKQVTWPTNIRWPYGRIPVLSYDEGYTDTVTLITTDSGVTWMGYFTAGWVPNA